MCSWRIQKSPDRRKTCLMSKVKTRRMRASLEIKVISVCLGIEHMIKRRKMASELKPVDNNHHYRVCRLCQSTKRVLRIAQTHGSQKRFGCNCEACWMWSMVKARCASLGLDISSVMDENALDGGAAASAADTSRPVVPFEGLGSSYK